MYTLRCQTICVVYGRRDEFREEVGHGPTKEYLILLIYLPMYLYKYDITSFILTMSIFFQIVILLILLSKKWVFDEKRKKKLKFFSLSQNVY